MTEYQRRALAQIERWAAGVPYHNGIDNECCPDFSCCRPEMFEPDAALRREQAERYRASVQGLH
jgi:hypothetical protein